MSEGALREHLQQREPEAQAKLLQVFLCLALVADLNALQRSARSHVSLLLVGEFIEQVVAYLVLDTPNGNIAAYSCLGTDTEVFLSCLQAKILSMGSAVIKKAHSWRQHTSASSQSVTRRPRIAIRAARSSPFIVLLSAHIKTRRILRAARRSLNLSSAVPAETASSMS